MAFHPPVDPRFVLALRLLAVFDVSYAEAWRLLRPVAARLGIPRPSYYSVRRILMVERAQNRRRKDELDRLMSDLLTGRAPFVTVQHKVFGR